MSFLDISIRDFSEALASKSPTPGGGGASALVAALGAALGTMVGGLTLGKKKYAGVEAEISVLMTEAEALRLELLDMIDGDAKAFEPLSKAYSIPRDDPERDGIMEACLINAAEAPMKILRLSCRMLELQQGFAEKGSELAASDAGTGAVFCRAAMYGAALNVMVNTKLMRDRDYADKLNDEVFSLTDKYGIIAEDVYESVLGRLK